VKLRINDGTPGHLGESGQAAAGQAPAPVRADVAAQDHYIGSLYGSRGLPEAKFS
jgi:hypothetical protein